MNINIGIFALLIAIALIVFMKKKLYRDLESMALITITFVVPLVGYSGFCFLNPECSTIKLSSIIYFDTQDDSRIKDLEHKYNELLKLKFENSIN